MSSGNSHDERSAATTPDLGALLALFKPEPYFGLNGKIICLSCQGRGEVNGRNHDDPRWVECRACRGTMLTDQALAALGRTK